MIGNKMPSFGIFLLTSLLVFTEAGPVNKSRGLNTCAVQCSGNNKFNYQPGTVYEFSYDAKTTTKMNGVSEDSATINMNAKVEIEPITKCDLVMRIKDASLRDSEDVQNSQAFKEAMMKQPLKFSFQDGRIDHICAMEGESTWTLNIKRGILSAFQNSMDSFDHNQKLIETDVVGSCSSEYEILDQGRGTMVVKKTKNLLGCSDREGYRLAVHSIGYNVPSFVKSLPLMKSDYKCIQTLDLGSNILKSSVCSEEHVFRPFSNGKNGAMTSNKQTLTFINKRNTGHSSNEHFSQRSTLKFHHQHDTSSKQEKDEKIEAKLQELCQKVAENIRPEVPEMVDQLIEHMRQVDRDILSRVYKKINQKNICAHKADRIKQYFHDAIPMVGTAASVGMIQELISKKHVTGSEAEMWLLSLSFVHNPTKEMVAAVMPLLNEPDVSGNTFLAISSLASSYCNVRPDCGKDSEISALIRKLMDYTNDCNPKNGDARRMVFALRALGNIGHSREVVSRLTHCSTRQDVREEIRIAAMDAFRRIPCDAMRSDLMGVFRDESEDSELRLNAYIALMKCPNREVLSEVHQVLQKEKSNQVGSFMWSHLTNLMETSDPHMQDIHNIVQDEELKKEFNLDQRKFSRNYEGSFFLDSINAGAKMDSNVIFSEKSFIPRSANLNLTIDLFGRAINFLEFGGRVQGMERILENFFGSSGVKEPKKKAQTPKDFDKSMDALRASAYLRVFGNELRYWDEQSLNKLQSSLHRLMDMQALSFSKSMQLLNSRMMIPTCVGLPLSLTMSSTGTISLDAKASLQRSKFELNVDFRPSASVQVKGEMSVDAHVSKVGVKMVTVAHTSTGAKLDIFNNKLDLQIPQKKMEIFNLKTDFYTVHRNAEKKQKMIVDNMRKHEICSGNLLKKVTGLSFCQIIKVPKASHHKKTPFSLFTGPVVYDLYMINEDAPNGYQIEGFAKQSPYSFYMDTPNSKVSRRIAIDAVMKSKNEAHLTLMVPWKNIKIEGTVVNMDEMKKLTGKLSFNEHTEYALNAELGMKKTEDLWSFKPKFEIVIPQRKLKYEGKIEVEPMKTMMIDMSVMGFIASDINLKVSGEIVPKEIGLTTQLKIGKKEYYIASRLGRLVSESGFKYTPFLKITIPDRDLVEFTSEILYESNKEMSFDFKLDKVFPKTTAMNAIVLLNTGKTKTKHILKVSFKSSEGNFRVTGEMDSEKTGITSRVIGSYDFGEDYSDHLTLSSKIRDLSVNDSVRYTGNIALASKKQDFLNFDLKGQLAKTSNHLETSFDLHYGNSEIQTNHLEFACVLNRALKESSHVYDYTMTIHHPGHKIDYRVEVHHLQSITWPFKKFENTMTVRSASENILTTTVSYSDAKEKGLLCYEAEASLSYRGKDMKISDKLVQFEANSFANYLIAHWPEGGNVLVNSSYNKTSTGTYITETTITLSGDKEIKVDGLMHVTPEGYEANLSLGADPGLMSLERVNYEAKAGVQYELKDTHVSTDASLDIMWAEDKKVSGSFNLEYTKDVSFISRLLLLTPSDVLKNFDAEIKWGLEKDNLLATITSSLNDKISIRQEVSYAYPNLQMAYTSHVDILDTKSDIAIDLDLTESTFNGTMKISEGEEIISDIAVRYIGHKTTVGNDFHLLFTILATSGKINMNTKFDSIKQIYESNGLASFQIPLPELDQIDASYNLKHGNDSSSIDVNYSSQLTNNKNDSEPTQVEMAFSFNGDKQMFNSTTSLKVISINVKVNGQKAVNLDFNVDLDTQAITFNMASTLTLKDSEKYEMSISYEHLSKMQIKTSIPSCQDELLIMFSGNLRAFNIQSKFSHNNLIYELDISNKEYYRQVEGILNTPYFQDTASFKIDGELSEMNVFGQLMHNKDKFELTISNSGYYQKIDAKLDTPYFQPTFNLSLMGDLKKFNLELEIHFDEEIYEMTASNEGYFQKMNFLLNTPFVNCDLMCDRDLDTGKGTLMVLFGKTKYEVSFNLICNLNDMQGTLFYKLDGNEQFKSKLLLKGYGTTFNAMMKILDIMDFELESQWDMGNVSLNLRSSLELQQKEIYKVDTIYEDMTRLHVKASFVSYNGEIMMTLDENWEKFNASLKMMPYFDTAQVEMKFTPKEFSAEMMTQFESLKQAKATLTFDGDWVRSQEVKSIFELNNEKMVELDINYNVVSISDFAVSIVALTSHMRYKEFQFDLKNKGPLNGMQSSLKLNLTDLFMLDAMLEKSGEASKVSLNVQLFDFNEWKSVLVLKDNLDSITATVITDIAKEEENKIDVSLEKSERSINVKVNGKKAVNLDFNMNLDTQAITFNMASTLTLKDSEKYEMYISYEHLSKMQIKTSIPSYQDELLIMFSGNLRAFNIQSKFSHNNLIYELDISNKEYYRQVEGILNTPYFQDTASFKIDGELSEMNVFGQLMHNKDKFELTISNSGYYQKIDAKLDTPYFQPTFNLSLMGDLKKFNLELEIHFDEEIYEMKASNDDYFRQMNFLLNTPKLNCNFESIEYGGSFNLTSNLELKQEEIYKIVATYEHLVKLHIKISIPSIEGELTMTLNGGLKMLNVMANLMHNTDKYEIIISNQDYYRKMDAQLVTPLFTDKASFVFTGDEDAFSAQAKFMHDNDLYEMVVSNRNHYRQLNITLSTPFSSDKLDIDFKGDLSSFDSLVTFSHNEVEYELQVSNVDYYRKINAKLTAPSIGTEVLFTLEGNLQTFSSMAELTYHGEKYTLELANKDFYRLMSIKLLTPFSDNSVSFSLDGNLDSFNAKLDFVHSKDQYELVASAKNYFREISGELITPQFGNQSLSVKINGLLTDFSGSVEVKNNDEMYKSEFSLKNKELHLSLPRWLEKLHVKLNSDWKNFQFIVQIMNYSGEKFEISVTNKKFREMKAHLAIPQMDDVEVFIETSENIRNGGTKIKMSFGENTLENDIKINFDGSQANFEIKPHYKILGRSGTVKLLINFMFETQSCKYEFEADIEGFQVKSMASVKISPEINILMTVNIPTLDASEMKLRLVSKGFQKSDMMLNLRSPWTGMTKVFHEHNGQMGKSFNAKGYIERDETRLAGYSLDTDFSNDYSLDFSCDYDNSKNKIETKANLNFQDVKTVLTLNANTTFQMFKEVFITAQYEMLKEGPNIKAEIKLPNQDCDLNIDSSSNDLNALLHLNMDKEKNDKHYQFLTSYKNTDQGADVSRCLNFKMILLERNVSLDFHFENSQPSMAMSGHFMWGDTEDQKATFKLMVQKESGKEIKLRVITPSRTIVAFSKVEINGNHYTMLGHIMMDESNQAQKVDIKADITILNDRADIDLTIKFPNQKKGMNLKTTVDVFKGDIIFSSNSEFSMDQDPQKTFKILTKLMSETKGTHEIYTVKMDARHAHSGFATEVIGRVARSPEKYNADLEMGYLNLESQQKKFAIRGEMHRHKHEVNFKLEAPSKTIEWNSHLFKDFTLFGYHKLTMYGDELKSYGNSLSQILKDEVSKKFADARRSFTEEMTPISDYFATEYKSLSEEFAKVMHGLN